jgi:hypothetical protein
MKCGVEIGSSAHAEVFFNGYFLTVICQLEFRLCISSLFCFTFPENIPSAAVMKLLSVFVNNFFFFFFFFPIYVTLCSNMLCDCTIRHTHEFYISWESNTVSVVRKVTCSSKKCFKNADIVQDLFFYSFLTCAVVRLYLFKAKLFLSNTGFSIV